MTEDDIELIPESELVDGEPPPDDLDKDYPWAAGDLDVMLRSFIFQTLASSEIDGAVAVGNMHAAYEWIKSAKLPKGKKPNLKTVESEP